MENLLFKEKWHIFLSILSKMDSSVFQIIRNESPDTESAFWTHRHNNTCNVIVLFPHQHPHSSCWAKWTLWRAAFAHGTSTLSRVLFLSQRDAKSPFWPLKSPLDLIMSTDVRQREVTHLVPLDITLRTQILRGLWHLIEYSKVFYNIYKDKQMTISMSFYSVSSI